MSAAEQSTQQTGTEQTGTDNWDDMTRRWRELYDQQAEVAKGWMEGQTELAKTLIGAGGSTDAAADAAAMAEGWRSSMALGGMLSKSLPGTEAGGIANEMLGRMLNPMSMTLVGGSQVGDVLRKMTEGPRFADVGGLERRMAELMELYVAVQTATRGYESVVASSWSEANQRFSVQVGERLRTGTPVSGSKEALALWMDIANDSLMATHRSEKFLAAQRQLLRSGMDFLLAERALVETLIEPAGLPTRTEIDEVHRSVQLLKRKVRALEKAAVGTARPVKSTARKRQPPKKTQPRKTQPRNAGSSS